LLRKTGVVIASHERRDPAGVVALACRIEVMATGLLDRYSGQIDGALSCFDRVVITGTLREVSHPEAMRAVMMQEGLRCFDIGMFAEPLRQRIRDNALLLAREAGVEVEYLAKSKGVRKEDLVAKVLARRGHHPGLVHVLSVVEGCTTFKPWHDKTTGKTGFKMVPGKCATYYSYLIDEDLGLMYVRVPTWLPCRLQVYFNGHNWLASKLRAEGMAFRMQDNAFVEVDDWERAQQLADAFDVAPLERKLHELAARFCPVVERFQRGYHWSVMQVEHALDVIFRKREELSPLYEEISRQAILAVKVPEMARFWDKRFSPEAVAQSDFKTLVEGTRIKHTLGRQSIKMYDKGGRILRIEVTSNDITFFRHHRKVVGRDGRIEYKLAPLKKSIYSLSDVTGLMAAASKRYLDFVGVLEDRTPQRHDLNKISRPARDERQRPWRGFNFFLTEDLDVLLALIRGEFAINGLSNRRLRPHLPDKTPSQIARILKRLRHHGMLKKVGKTYRYYLTDLGKRTIIAARKLTEHLILPSLSPSHA
jgi:hypothetical protein